MKHGIVWWVFIGWWWYLFFAWWIYPIKRIMLQKRKRSGSVGLERYRVEWSDAQERLIRDGYKEAGDYELFPPDTVWATPRAKVYHYSDSCVDGIVLVDGEAMKESEALRRGLRRCMRCDWHGVSVPAPGKRPSSKVKPVSRAKVTKL